MLTPTQVLSGMFGLAKRLFDVDVEPADGQAPIWHPDVRFFRLLKVGGWWGGRTIENEKEVIQRRRLFSKCVKVW
jgi:hypothetical protein